MCDGWFVYCKPSISLRIGFAGALVEAGGVDLPAEVILSSGMQAGRMQRFRGGGD
jgi:hypothetical protein